MEQGHCPLCLRENITRNASKKIKKTEEGNFISICCRLRSFQRGVCSGNERAGGSLEFAEENGGNYHQISCLPKYDDC